MGDLSLLYSRANLEATNSGQTSKSNRRRQKPTSVETNRHGTKGRSNGGTKSKGSSMNRNHVAPAAAPTYLDGFNSTAMEESNTDMNKRIQNVGNKGKNIICYYGSWAVYRPDAGKFNVENIDPFLCTHVIYGFVGLSYDNMVKVLDPWNDLEDNYGKGAMKRFTNLKRTNPDLKTLVAIGGWNEGSVKYSKMASEPESRRKFVRSVVQFLEKHNFDGLDLDWEYPGSRGGASYDKQNFITLLRELSEAFKPHRYLLTAAVSAGKQTMDAGYDVGAMGKYLDLINLMAYDYHGAWETTTGLNAPLFGSKKFDLTPQQATLNVNWSVNYWLAQGAPREKLMLGVGSYGRSFTLNRGEVNGLNAPASQAGRAGPYTREPGSLGFNEICSTIKANPHSWTIVRDPDYLAPYAYNSAERQWVGFDDPKSLELKARFAQSMGLGGMMMWSIETDDFQGVCHGEKFLLLKTIKRLLQGHSQLDSSTTTTQRPFEPTTTSTRRPPVSTTRRPTTTQTTPSGEIEDDPVSSTTWRPATSSTQRPTTQRPITQRPTTQRPTTQRPTTQRPDSGEFTCNEDGMFADPRNCRKFYRCVNQGSYFQSYKFDCAPGTGFNEAQKFCDFIYNVPSCKQQQQNERLLYRRNQQQASAPQLYYPGYFDYRFKIDHGQ